jgi:hypothetical protein
MFINSDNHKKKLVFFFGFTHIAASHALMVNRRIEADAKRIVLHLKVHGRDSDQEICRHCTVLSDESVLLVMSQRKSLLDEDAPAISSVLIAHWCK